MVRLGPIQSSTQPKAKDPRAAVTLSVMPNSRTCSWDIPNTPAAKTPPMEKVVARPST